MNKTKDDAEKYFQEELKRLKTDYVDYYLMHMLTDVKTWERLKELGIAEWAFRWLWNQPEMTCVLSGMNSLEMVEENVKNASSSCVGEFTEKEETLLKEVVDAINEKMKVGCTGCG